MDNIVIKKEKSCGCVVLNENRVLLVKHNAGHWDFPKGHIEANETEVQTAIREVKEETNIDVKIVPGYRYTVQYSPKEYVEKQVVYFIAENLTNNIKAQVSEVSNVEWVNLDIALDKITYDDSKNVLRKVITEYLKNN